MSRLPRIHGRTVSTAVQFYQNKQLEIYASKAANRLSLRQLIFYGRSMNEERLIKSANYVRTELPVRIAHRLRHLQTLPYIVVTQEEVAKIYNLYWAAFEKLRRYPQVTNLSENVEFCHFLRSILDEHAAVIPMLAVGLSLSSPNLAPDELDSVMKRMLVSRISRRVLAEHHIALSDAFNTNNHNNPDRVGIINTSLPVKQSVDSCVRLLKETPERVLCPFGEDAEVGRVQCPDVIVDGHTDTRFPYIREHFEYIVFELLKNSMYATSAHHTKSAVLPAIRATISSGKDDIQVRISDQGGGLAPARVGTPSDLFSFSHTRNAARLEDSRIGALRTISSRPKGMYGTVQEQISQWRKEAPSLNITQDAGLLHPRIGIGLPMSNIFATYFGGSLELVPMDGWGTDVYLRLPKLGTNLEGIEV